MIKRAFALVFVLSAAFAACGDKPYTLKTSFGFLAGDALTYEGDTLKMINACFSSKPLHLYMEAQEISYHKNISKLHATEPKGKLKDWKFKAKELEATQSQAVLYQATVEKGRMALWAERVVYDGKEFQLFELKADTPGYRFYAAKGYTQGKEFVVEEVRATPCREGSDFALFGDRATFDIKSGRLLIEKSRIRYYGLCLAKMERLDLYVGRPPKVSFPFRFSIGDGLTVGVVNMPLAKQGLPLGGSREKFTFLMEALGSDHLRVRSGYIGPAGRLNSIVGKDFFLLTASHGDFRLRVQNIGKGFLEYAPAFKMGEFTLTPTTVAHTSNNSTGLLAAIKLRWVHGQEFEEGQLHLAPQVELVYNPLSGPWMAYGGKMLVRFQDATFSLAGSEVFGKPTSYWGVLEGKRYLASTLTFRDFEANFRADLARKWSYLIFGYDRHFKFQVRKAFNILDDRLEVIAGYDPPPPPPWQFSFSPELGYDVTNRKLSRVGVGISFADGCFVYRFNVKAVFSPWLKEREGISVSANLTLP